MKKIPLTIGIVLFLVLTYFMFWGNKNHQNIKNSEAFGPVDALQSRFVGNTRLEIAPTSNNWIYAEQFELTNTDTKNVNLAWRVNCNDLTKCSNSSGTIILTPNQKVRYGPGGVCSSWSFNLTSPVSTGYNVLPNPYTCSPPPKILATPVPNLCNGNCVTKEAGEMDNFGYFSQLSSNVQQNQQFWAKLNIKGQDMPNSPQPTPQGNTNTTGNIIVNQSGGLYCNVNTGQITISGRINVNNSVYRPKLRVNIVSIKTSDRKITSNYRWYETYNGDNFTLTGQWPGVNVSDPFVELWFQLRIDDNYYSSTNVYKNIVYYWNAADCAGSTVLTRLPSTIQLTEKINNSTFEVEPLNPTTFKLTKNGSDITSSVCPGMSCISGADTNGFTLNLPEQTADETTQAYFKVNAKNITTGGTSTKLNNPLNNSIVSYQNGYSEAIGNTDVNVVNPPPFFNVSNFGNIYSNSGINNQLSANKQMLGPDPGILYYNANLNLGDGGISSTNQVVSGYDTNVNYEYAKMLDLYKSQIQIKNISSINDISAPGYYYSESPNLTIGGAGWDDATFNAGRVVVFVSQDLYIKRGTGQPFKITSDGINSLIFVVAGKIGIDPLVNEVQGIFISDGVIDTVCDAPLSGTNVNCTPDSSSPASNSPLTLNGAFVSNSGGYKLERTWNSNGEPSEKFIYRVDLFMSATDILGLRKYSWKENKN